MSRRDTELPRDHCIICGAVLEEKVRAFVNLGSNIALLDGKALRLTPNQAVILHTLLSTMPRLATFGFIMDQLYGLGASDEPSDKVIGVHIHRLRKQLKETNYRIENIWGKGFRFIRIPEHERDVEVDA